MGDGKYTLITGGAGFVGSNLADALLSSGETVVVFDDLSRRGVESNVEWLREKHGKRLRVEIGDVAEADRVRPLVHGADAVYHLAAQVAVTTSIREPADDLRTNLTGTFNVLEAMRSAPEPPPLLYTSTNKVYGGLEEVQVEHDGSRYRYSDGRAGISESAALDFHSPYGCSKGAADQYVRDYARIYGLWTVVFRMSCIYGTRQFGTEDQGWVAHFARSLLRGLPITVYGDGDQVRDLLWVEDLVGAMRSAMTRIDVTRGEVFNVGGGPGNAASVRQVIGRLMEIAERRVPLRMDDWRPGDQRIYISDTDKLERFLGWRVSTSWEHGLERLVEWMRESNLGAAAVPLRTDRRVSGAAL
jgi:CDP-paratose 2-epimerase